MNGDEYLDRRETILHLQNAAAVMYRSKLICRFFTLHVRDKECLALQTTYKTRLHIARRSV